jgi:hypothetical protein
VPGEAPVVRLTISIDESGARDAIAQLSDVSVDASASTGSGPLTYTIDFGDGVVVREPASRHVYADAGRFTIRCEARDSHGRTAAATHVVDVKPLTGRWFHAGYVQATSSVEVRRLTILAQEGLTVRGVYSHTSTGDRPFSATLTRLRTLQIHLPNGVSLTGVIPGRLNEDAEPWLLHMRGDSVDDQRLEFQPIGGEPVPPEPDAVLRVRFGSLGFAHPIVDLTPIEFDGSTSRGTRLSHFIEFGDGEFAGSASAVHKAHSPCPTTARLTVVDRFGRTDSEPFEYCPAAFGRGWGDGWVFADLVSKFLRFDVRTRDGVNYGGMATYGYQSQGGRTAPFVAMLSGERDVHIVVPQLGIEFRGSLDLTGEWSGKWKLILTQTGGLDHGRIWQLGYDDGPG